MTFADLQKSLEIFSLSQRATLKELKARHRELVRRHHPDSGNQSDPERIKLINAAYKILLAYADSYKLSFSEAEFYEQNPEERLRRQFAYDPVWGVKDGN